MELDDFEVASELTFLTAPPASWIKVSGEDAADFLQGQFSNDLRGAIGKATYGLWLDHRGRIRGDSTVLRMGAEDFVLHSWKTPAKELCERLESHIVADDVELCDATKEVSALIVNGPIAGDPGKKIGLELPAPERWSSTGEVLVFAAQGDQLPHPSWIVISEPDGMNSVRRSLGATVEEADPEDWHARRIRAGVPLVPMEAGPADTPSEVGLEAFCSADKGCYLGQEVVARQRRLGRRTRQLHVVRVSRPLRQGQDLPLELFSGDDQVGELRGVAWTGSDGIGLAMLKTRFLSGNSLKMTNASGDVEVTVHGH